MFTYRLGAFTGGAAGTAFGSAFKATRTAAAGGPQQVTDIAVPAGATRLTVTIGNASDPAAGTWKAVVDLFAIPSGSTSYSYSDVYAQPTLGGVTVADPTAAHARGSSWSAVATATPGAAPAAGRLLQGFVQVKAGPAVIGQAEVD